MEKIVNYKPQIFSGQSQVAYNLDNFYNLLGDAEVVYGHKDFNVKFASSDEKSPVSDIDKLKRARFYAWMPDGDLIECILPNDWDKSEKNSLENLASEFNKYHDGNLVASFEGDYVRFRD